MCTFETYYGCLHTKYEFLQLSYICFKGYLGRVQRRLSDTERSKIRPGSVFVYLYSESKIMRWTDGKHWSTSKVCGIFTTYLEQNGNMLKKVVKIELESDILFIVCYNDIYDEVSRYCCKKFQKLRMDASMANHDFVRFINSSYIIPKHGNIDIYLRQHIFKKEYIFEDGNFIPKKSQENVYNFFSNSIQEEQMQKTNFNKCIHNIKNKKFNDQLIKESFITDEKYSSSYQLRSLLGKTEENNVGYKNYIIKDIDSEFTDDNNSNESKCFKIQSIDFSENILSKDDITILWNESDMIRNVNNTVNKSRIKNMDKFKNDISVVNEMREVERQQNEFIE